MEPIELQLDALDTALQQLLAVLDKERQALISRSTDTLAQLAEQKLALVQDVGTYDLLALSDQISTLPDQTRQECDAKHSSVVKSAQLVRDSNLVNGMIVRRTQQSTSELLRILSGKPRNGLYGTTGTPVAGGETTAATIAKA